MKIIRLAGRKIKGWMIGTPEGAKFILDPGQGLGESCHDVLDITNKGNAIATSNWSDPTDEATVTQVQQQILHQ